MLIIYLFDYYTDYLIYFYILYGPPLVAVTYVLSYLFNDESGAQNKMILLNFLVGALGSSVLIILRGIEKTKKVGKILEYIFCLLPAFAFNFGYNMSISKLTIFLSDYPKEWMFFEDDVMIRKFNLLMAPLVYLEGEVILYILILFLIEFFSFSSHPKEEKTVQIPAQLAGRRDSGVLKEEQKALGNLNNENNDKIQIKTENSDEENSQMNNPSEKGETKEYTIRVCNLKKVYNNSKILPLFCCGNKGKTAIKHLSFCVEQGECFGLLGLNGAGKTSTFKCITQEIVQDSGSIFINGVNSANNFDKLKNVFGYCPQYDAIFEYMTVYENLEFYAKVKGVKPSCISNLVKAMIYVMRLDEFTNKMSGRLSGGNKRKLSVAISMLCNPPIILLDEPSTGMDPEARRFMWSVIHKMATKGKKSSIIMTTHSMDEAETLCKRMAIMVNGEFVCLGKANEIKNKYGYGYELNLRIKPMTDQQELDLFFNKYDSINITTKVKKDNIESILTSIERENYINELKEGRLGEKIQRDIEINGSVSISALLNWIFFVENAMKFIYVGRDKFEKIILEEHMDNSFLFKMKKLREQEFSIGFLFGLYDTNKEECFVTEYSIQPTSLEQIFNKFAESQSSVLIERRSTIVEPGDVENISMHESDKKRLMQNKNQIIITQDLYSALVKY